MRGATYWENGQRRSETEYEALYDLIVYDACDTATKARILIADLMRLNPKWQFYFAGLGMLVSQISESEWANIVAEMYDRASKRIEAIG